MYKLTNKGEMPAWALILALIVGLLVIIFIIWLSMKGGTTIKEQLAILP